MSGRPAPIIVEEDGTRLGGYTHVAAELRTTPGQVYSWATRRASSRFPEPVRRGVIGGREVDLYDIDRCRVWRIFEYNPQRGKRRRPEGEDPDRGGPADIGRLLGVRTKQVCKWIERRARNASPAPGPDGLYDLAAWSTWHAWYTALGSEVRAGAARRLAPELQDEPERGAPAIVAAALREPLPTVYRWIERRQSTACPMPDEDGLYSLAEWRAWHEAWRQRPGVIALHRRWRAA